MRFLDKLIKVFRKEHKEELPKEPFEQREVTGDEPICGLCEQPIFPEQRSKKFQDKIFHIKPCWFKLQKEAERQRWDL